MSMCLGLYVCMSACVYMHVYLGTTIWEDYLAESETLSYMHVLCVYVYVCICVCALMYVDCSVANLTLAGPEHISV